MISHQATRITTQFEALFPIPTYTVISSLILNALFSSYIKYFDRLVMTCIVDVQHCLWVTPSNNRTINTKPQQQNQPPKRKSYCVNCCRAIAFSQFVVGIVWQMPTNPSVLWGLLPIRLRLFSPPLLSTPLPTYLRSNIPKLLESIVDLVLRSATFGIILYDHPPVSCNTLMTLL